MSPLGCRIGVNAGVFRLECLMLRADTVPYQEAGLNKKGTHEQQDR